MEQQTSFLDQTSIAFKSYGKAIQLLFTRGLWVYMIYPIIIYILLLAAEFYFAGRLYDAFKSMIFQWIDPENFHSSWMSFIFVTMHYFLWIGLHIIFFLIIYLFGKYIVLILMSPIMAVLSAKTESILTGKKYPFSLSQLFRDVFRGVAIAFRNMFFQLLILLASCFLIWIPVIGWLCPIFLLIISYYFSGSSMLDYVSERRKLSVADSILFVRENKGLAIGNGFIFTLLFALPFIGVVLSTVFSPIAACVSVLEKEGKI